jgi:hypothetical protein
MFELLFRTVNACTALLKEFFNKAFNQTGSTNHISESTNESADKNLDLAAQHVTEPDISEMLLNEIIGWEVVDIPHILYHGCQNGDLGVDIENQIIDGNKWFSTNQNYAASYAWFLSRPESPLSGSRHCLKVGLAQSHYKAIVRPAHITSFPQFLAKCFPHVPQGYALSRNFQNTLKAHLEAAFGKDSGVIGYYWRNDQSEICIPDCGEYVAVSEFFPLPDNKDLLNA